MARATRSSVSSQTTTKKRKRNDDEDSTEQPPTKQAKSQDVPLDQPIFIQNDQAEKILAVLEMIDAQGLLDRVFPLPSDESRSFSFRTLLKECTEHPLSVLQSAVQNLFPISSHPRAPPSKPAAQQLRFCQLALSLLSQASTQSIRVHLDEVETLIPSEHTADEADDNPQSPPNHYLAPRYALVQHLPQGDYWTSLNSSAPSDNSRELKDLPHGHADLVAILPSARFSKPLSSIPTLGSYHTKVLPSYSKLPAPRIISRGSFLDYGPFASFAPTYEQDGTEVGRQELGEVYLARDERRKEKGKILKEWAENREKEKCLIAPGTTNEVDDVDMVEEIRNPASSENFEEELQELLPADEVESLKAALGCLDLELAVQELLNRNRRALERLQELQHRRLVAEGGGSSQVEEGSEEWDTAQGIFDSLTVLASLRPRSSTGEHPPFVLVPKALHTLRRTLPLAPMSGWHGNLPPGRGTALRDDSTVKVRSGVSVPAVPVAAPIPTPAANTPAAPYNYSYYAQTPSQQMQYGRNGTTSTPTATYAVPYKPGGTFYPTPQQGSYYSAAQSYAAASAATGHQPYAHSGGWYSTYTPQIANAASTASTSSAAASTTPTPSYSSFFSAAATPAQRRSTLAVANTVAQNGWTVANGTTPVATNALTLPVHLRPNGQQSPFYGYTPPQTPIPATPAK